MPKIAAGKPFTVAIVTDAGAGDRVSVERRLVDGTVRWRDPVAVTPAAALSRTKGGALLYPVDAMPAASRATVQFTLIGADGSRGASRRVALKAEGAKTGCTSATCGTVLSVRDAPRGFDVVVRMDDRSIRTVPQPSRSHLGSRVRIAGDQLLPAR